MSAKNQFDWIPFYEEFADKLLAYKDNRQELIEKIKQVYEVTGIKLPTLERNEDGENEIRPPLIISPKNIKDMV